MPAFPMFCFFDRKSMRKAKTKVGMKLTQVSRGNHYSTTIHFMSSLLYLIAVILIVGWILGFFVYSAGGLIHILLVFAIIALLMGVIRRA
jgi:hypothetical protein